MLEAKTKCLACEKDFPSFHSLEKHKKSEHSKLLGTQDITVDLEPFMGDYHGPNFREELTGYPHFLVDSDFV